MFPVTLVDDKDEALTVWPPCYGFLKLCNYERQDGCDDDDDWDYDDYSTRYECNEGWNILMTSYHSDRMSNQVKNASAPSEEILGDLFPMTSIKEIWNSGTHFPLYGRLYGKTKVVAEQYDHPLAETGDVGKTERPLSNVETWAQSANMPEVTVKAVMDMFEDWLDHGRESCFVWKDNGCFGVKTDGTPADRALFYLMLNRSLYTNEESEQVHEMLDNIYFHEMTPVQALILSRLIITSNKGLFGETQNVWVGNDYDSCLLPASLITVGMGRRFKDKIQVEWRQDEYRSGLGHKRDDDFSHLEYKDPYTTLNNSMFLPILHPSLSKVTNKVQEISERCLMVAFAEAISLDEATFNKIKKNQYTNNPVNLYHMIQVLNGGNLGSNKNYQVKSPSEWKDILFKLFM